MESMEGLKQEFNFFLNKKVFVTGHTGFKGSWLLAVLKELGAEICGYSLPSPTTPNLFTIAKLSSGIQHIEGDVRDFDLLNRSIKAFQPDVVIHLAAQPLVIEGYRDPIGTYASNVMGTVNILESVRRQNKRISFLNVTTDKVYKNKEWVWGYRENEELNGHDPYSNSKSCSELVTHSFKSSYFIDGFKQISTARAGNVIGGGDFSENRIIPDCVRSALNKTTITVRNPNSVRPYQHVLEPLFAYLLIVAKQAEDSSYSGSYNVGPNEGDCLKTKELVNLFCKSWGEGLNWTFEKQLDAPHEANLLRLDISKIKNNLGWTPVWNARKAIEKTVEWSKIWASGGDAANAMKNQINEYLREMNE
ncbi:CDP-glucose 4,6-dehydratase [Parasutterella muris]|uniref:CDP-glucose 4,6-dehydratase n=1 Tax=Parasutterella muris TaxID=2565572 RepID=UPI00203FCE5D|nr:CDP-glucose 4,6-dehydratase [Parasutterella muris]